MVNKIYKEGFSIIQKYSLPHPFCLQHLQTQISIPQFFPSINFKKIYLTMPISHTGITVPPERYEEIVNFYLKALAPIGYVKILDYGSLACGLGPKDGHPDWWIGNKEGVTPITGLHVAFDSDTWAKVREFHDAAMAAGAKDNGPAGLRPDYMPHYYAAFVLDPLGNNLEVCCVYKEAVEKDEEGKVNGRASGDAIGDGLL
ncbi:hypothetical protein M501DRAFT_979700 [Patellaria atrata CBS 101060]|uniref:VOC domain-containing protein n=1 Tax=Patellaria atrata CBS 101060 TaxID=1346257 RepID=A0A9P4S5Y0_9PEZI|nr:hypothetical protein M501DRAFT_979700 [Patellaria atrata CBS 101060]